MPVTRAPRSRSVWGSGAGAATSIVPGTRVAPASSTRSLEAIAWARIVSAGWSCFSNRAEASERSDSRREVRSTFAPFQFATSSSTSVVSSETSETWPPISAAIPVGWSRSQTSTVSASSSRSTPSSVVIFSPGRAVRTISSPPGSFARS